MKPKTKDVPSDSPWYFLKTLADTLHEKDPDWTISALKISIDPYQGSANPGDGKKFNYTAKIKYHKFHQKKNNKVFDVVDLSYDHRDDCPWM